MKMKYFVNSSWINKFRIYHHTHGPFESFKEASIWMTKHVKELASTCKVADFEEENSEAFGHEIHMVVQNSIGEFATMRFEVASFEPAWETFK